MRKAWQWFSTFEEPNINMNALAAHLTRLKCFGLFKTFNWVTINLFGCIVMLL